MKRELIDLFAGSPVKFFDAIETRLNEKMMDKYQEAAEAIATSVFEEQEINEAGEAKRFNKLKKNAWVAQQGGYNKAIKKGYHAFASAKRIGREQIAKEEQEPLSEISSSTLSSYDIKASKKMGDLQWKGWSQGLNQNEKNKVSRLYNGRKLASKKIANKNVKVPASEEVVDEAIQSEHVYVVGVEVNDAGYKTNTNVRVRGRNREEATKNARLFYKKQGKVVEKILSAKRLERIREEQEPLEELSKGTLGRYVKKASDETQYKSYLSGRYMDTNPDQSNKHWNKSKNRIIGIIKAVDRLTKEEVIDESESLTKYSVETKATHSNPKVYKPQQMIHFVHAKSPEEAAKIGLVRSKADSDYGIHKGFPTHSVTSVRPYITSKRKY